MGGIDHSGLATWTIAKLDELTSLLLERDLEHFLNHRSLGSYRMLDSDQANQVVDLDAAIGLGCRRSHVVIPEPRRAQHSLTSTCYLKLLYRPLADGGWQVIGDGWQARLKSLRATLESLAGLPVCEDGDFFGGVSIRDVAESITQTTGPQAGVLTRQLQGSGMSKRLEAIGRCPNDGRATLYSIETICADIKKNPDLGPREKVRIRKELMEKQRHALDV